MIYRNPSDPELTAILAAVDKRPNPGSFAQASRKLTQEMDGLFKIKLFQASSFTLDSITPYCRVAAARRGMLADIGIAPFSTVHQQLLDPMSDLAKFEPNVVFITQLLNDVSPRLCRDFGKLSESEVDEQIDEIVSQLHDTLSSYRAAHDTPVVLGNFPRPVLWKHEIYETELKRGMTQALDRLNDLVVGVANDIAGVCVLNFENVCQEVGYENCYDSRLWHIGHAPLTFQSMVRLANEQAAIAATLLTPPRKCLVLDLDNTLWGGVVGEDKIEGILLGQTYPGNIYRSVQEAALRLHHRGVLLAINSKNNEADVTEVFAKHPDMVLRPEHIAASRVNWQPKIQNMREIAGELNIGVDSLVFIDDNPVEIEAMRAGLPEVISIGAHDTKHHPDPLVSLEFISSGRCFERLTLTDEDRNRGQMYAEQIQRRDLESQSGSLEVYLDKLKTVVKMQPADEFSIPRVAELIAKTNQFNLSTRRHNESAIQRFSDSESDFVLTFQVEDRFGAHGTVGTVILRIAGDTAEIDTFLMSCRVIGRDIERAMLCHVIRLCREENVCRLTAEFVPTAKNAPAANFLSCHGFQETSTTPESSMWNLELNRASVVWPTHISKPSELGVTG